MIGICPFFFAENWIFREKEIAKISLNLKAKRKNPQKKPLLRLYFAHLFFLFFRSIFLAHLLLLLNSRLLSCS
jgi:hypothetical protein